MWSRCWWTRQLVQADSSSLSSYAVLPASELALRRMKRMWRRMTRMIMTSRMTRMARTQDSLRNFQGTVITFSFYMYISIYMYTVCTVHILYMYVHVHLLYINISDCTLISCTWT
jgi:hypothetical protein